MAQLYLLEPEVAGGWGPGTIVTNRAELKDGTASILNVTRLEYRFEEWVGDELLETHPCYIATEQLTAAMTMAGLSGFTVDDVTITMDEDFVGKQTRQGLPFPLPRFKRIIPRGQAQFNERYEITSWSGDDVCIAHYAGQLKNDPISIIEGPPRYSLCVSGRCYECLRGFHLQICRVKEAQII